MSLEISIIIPCFNEVKTIGGTIEAASDELRKAGFNFEIIVVDNGSTDGSDRIAKSKGANLIYSNAASIAGVRNSGVEIANGQVLVFLDADIIVQQGWGDMLRSVYTRMIKDDNIITGSHPQVPENIRPIIRSWYKGLSNDLRDTHLGTGHMILSKATFDRVGRFDETLKTNEDFYFCQEAKKKGVKVVSKPELKVLHLGYPNTLIDFAKREIWHGSGYCNNLRMLLRSRVAWSGTVFLFLNIIMLILLFVNLTLFVLTLSAAFLMASGINFFKFGYGNIRDFIYRSVISYIYLISRGLSLPIYFLKKNKFYHWVYRKKSYNK